MVGLMILNSSANARRRALAGSPEPRTCTMASQPLEGRGLTARKR